MIVLLALIGAGLVGLPGWWFRIDQVVCASWPSLQAGVAFGTGYLVGVGLLTYAWVRLAAREGPRLGLVLLAGAAVHAVAMVAPPFLSHDPLFYSAIGRAMARFHASPDLQLSHVLPAGDPFLTILPVRWQDGTSAYGAGFNQLAALVAYVGGDDLAVHLRLYQLIGLAALVASAALVAAAAGGELGGRAAATVLFCPLAVVDGTQSAHNDTLLALGVAACVFALSRRRPWLALAGLVAGVLVKASAWLWVGVHLGQHAWGLVAGAPVLRRRRILWSVGLAAGAAAAVLLVWQGAYLLELMSRATALVGKPTDPFEYCTRSIECLPRILLREIAHQPRLAWEVNLGFRALGAAVLLYIALRTRAPERRLPGLACAIFFYYLYLHGWSQSWYLLPLLPLLPFADHRLRPAMWVLCVAATAYYALVMPFSCVPANFILALVDFIEAGIVILPATIVLLWPKPGGSTTRWS